MVKVHDSLMDKSKKNRRNEWVLTSVAAFLAALVVLVVYLSTFVLFVVRVSGSSMYPTLTSGQNVICNCKAEPKVGDIVVIRDERADAFIIKRVIALEGQTVEIKGGDVYVDGQKLIEPYTNGNTWDYDGNWSNRTVRKGEIFYLGDNRINSKDSRFSEYDTCSVKQIVGVVPDWAVNAAGITSVLL